MRGTAEIKIGGESRPIKFGINQSAKYCEIRECSLAKMQEELTNVEGSDAGLVRDLIYSALWAGYKKEKKEMDFDLYDIGDWIDEMAQDEINKAFQVLVDSNSGSDGGATEAGK